MYKYNVVWYDNQGEELTSEVTTVNPVNAGDKIRLYRLYQVDSVVHEIGVEGSTLYCHPIKS